MKNPTLWLRNAAAGLALAAAITPSIAAPTLGMSYTRTDTTVDVTVSASNVADLYAYQFSLAFDPFVLAATGVTEGPFLATGGSTFFSPGSIDNVGGTIAFIFDTLLGAGPGVDGSGVLATISFDIGAAGITTLALSDVLGLDSALNDAGLTAPSALVVAVPEPGTLWLLAAAAAALAFAAPARFGRRLPAPQLLAA